jgi:hypothetical protein
MEHSFVQAFGNLAAGLLVARFAAALAAAASAQ